MSTILLTGATGFIGNALAKALATRHQLICIGRNRAAVDAPWIRGDFGSFEALRGLDTYQIDAVIHLAAVTGGCLESDGMSVNVEGTRCLMRYLIDAGCKKFVNASSIAVLGAQDPGFRPLQLPIADEHPCLDRDGYGFSKYMMEELTRYYARQNPQLDIINLRLAAIVPDENPPAPEGSHPPGPGAGCGLTRMTRSEAVRAFAMAAESPYQPGLRIMNAAPRRAWASVPTADILRHWWGDAVDLSYYDRPENRFAGVYEVSRIEKELGFVAKGYGQ